MDKATLASLEHPQAGKRFLHTFWPIQPAPPSDHLELPARASFCSIETVQGRLIMHLWCRGAHLDSFGLSVQVDDNDQFAAERIAKAMNHVLTTIRSSGFPSAHLTRMGEGTLVVMYEDDCALPTRFPIAGSLQQEGPWPAVDFAAINSAFAATINTSLEPLMALIAESALPGMPVHYRILSLVRGLELLFDGDEKLKADWVNGYQSKWDEIGLGSGKFAGDLARLRARCAHGVPGKDELFSGSVVLHEEKLLGLVRLLTEMLHAAMNKVTPHGMTFAMIAPA